MDFTSFKAFKDLITSLTFMDCFKTFDLNMDSFKLFIITIADQTTSIKIYKYINLINL